MLDTLTDPGRPWQRVMPKDLELSAVLAEQGLEALGELLRGFQAADEASGGSLLGEALREDRASIYDGLLTALMRIVFLLYAEDRGLLPASPANASAGSVTDLFERLNAASAVNAANAVNAVNAINAVSARESRVHNAEEPRCSAWAQLLTLFDRALFDRAPLEPLRSVPGGPRALFDPDAYPFLEGRPRGSRRATTACFSPPKVADSAVHRVLEKLLSIDGERLSYRALDVEQLGVIYEGLMGYALEIAPGPSSIPVRPKDVLPAGALYLRPTEERRRSGSHYTPRSLTEPIVRTTLDPILAALTPGPEAILALKVADPAMGSGAFLVEVCRYLADALVRAWQQHGVMPELPPDADPVLHARRLIAQRCLYGVDKNPLAVDLARLSLWLFTQAKDHPLTFLDRSLRHGDSLVGLSRDQIATFTWDLGAEKKQPLLGDAEASLDDMRLLGDLVIAAFFDGQTEKARRRTLAKYAAEARLALAGQGDRRELSAVATALREGERPAPPFHWEIELPEVFSRQNPGFDAFVGNPPFAGKNTLADSTRRGYRDWIKTIHPGSHGNSDLVAHFFRRAFSLLREGATFGLIATNTIAQGDTRSTGLRWICQHGGTIYAARSRTKWPSEGAAVVVSVVHARRGEHHGPRSLNGRSVPRITSYLFDKGSSDDPFVLASNQAKSFIGSYVLGMGFTFDDTDTKRRASSLSTMERLKAASERNASRIFPYIGGEEVNESPTHSPHRYIIDFGDLSEAEARQWPDLMRILERKVKPRRLSDKRESYRRYWWQYAEKRVELARARRELGRVLVLARLSRSAAFTMLPSGVVPSEQLVVFITSEFCVFAALQSRAHEIWARFFSSSMKDDLRYTPSRCFETFPCPIPFHSTEDARLKAHRAALEAAGSIYYERRAALMIKNNQGLTATYNRFHDPGERSPEIQALRDLHAEMDRAVLAAYGWTDIPTSCEFLLDYQDQDPRAEHAGNPRKRRPWRYRWPDDIRDEILARLIDLNQARAAEERLLGTSRAASRGR